MLRLMPSDLKEGRPGLSRSTYINGVFVAQTPCSPGEGPPVLDCLTAECQMGPEEAEGRAPASAAAALILKLPFGSGSFLF